jgi:hypothetical protein
MRCRESTGTIARPTATLNATGWLFEFSLVAGANVGESSVGRHAVT